MSGKAGKAAHLWAGWRRSRSRSELWSSCRSRQGPPRRMPQCAGAAQQGTQHDHESIVIGARRSAPRLLLMAALLPSSARRRQPQACLLRLAAEGGAACGQAVGAHAGILADRHDAAAVWSDQHLQRGAARARKRHNQAIQARSLKVRQMQLGRSSGGQQGEISGHHPSPPLLGARLVPPTGAAHLADGSACQVSPAGRHRHRLTAGQAAQQQLSVRGGCAQQAQALVNGEAGQLACGAGGAGQAAALRWGASKGSPQETGPGESPRKAIPE